MPPRNKAALAAALEKEARRLKGTPPPIRQVPKEPERSLVAEKIHLDRFIAPADDEAMALQAELRLLEEIQTAASNKQHRSRMNKVMPDTSNTLLKWSYPSKYLALNESEVENLLLNDSIAIEDPLWIRWVPIQRFKHMRLDPHLINYLMTVRDIKEPTPIQKIALPIILSGRDTLGIAGTGSGKTLCYIIPMAYACCDARVCRALALVPSRELAVQVKVGLQAILNALGRRFHRTPARAGCIIGGVPMSRQFEELNGVAYVATPGRLKDLIEKGVCSLTEVAFLAIDEADRLFDIGFEDVVQSIMKTIRSSQVVMFSATVPMRLKYFMNSILKVPVCITIGKANRAAAGIIQRVDLIAKHRRLKFLLAALQETPPPVMVFCKLKQDVDDVVEFLLNQGIDAAGIHGDLCQEDRLRAVEAFTQHEKDILVGTDVASKGLDFPEVRHIINYDMPDEIDTYIHRIGRTSRRQGQGGVATTFVHNCVASESVLLDMRALLLEARQYVPKFLQTLAKLRGYPDVTTECAYCGGPGHRVIHCPRMKADNLARFAQHNKILS